MEIEKQEYYSVRDSNLLDVWGMGNTKEEAFHEYKINLLSYKEKIVDQLRYIEKLEMELIDGR